MIRKDNILSLQNAILKIFVSIVLIIISSIISFDKFFIIFGFTFVYMFISPIIYLVWLKTLLRITPFFISLFIFGILFQIPFPDQCFLSMRIIYLLLVSVYLTETTSIDSIISGKVNFNYGFWLKFKFLLAATIHFIPMLANKFKDNKFKHKNIIDLMVKSMEDCFKDVHDVEVTTMDRIIINNKNRKVSVWANIYLSLLVIIPILFILTSY